MSSEIKKFKAVVIDDETKRNKTYLKVLGDKYNVKIINNINEVDRKAIMKNDIMIIDVWFGEFTAFRIIEEYGLSLPTVLISGKWTDEQGEPNDIILSVPNHKNIIKVISWNSFNNNGSNIKIGEEIFYQFCKYKNMLISDNEEKFSILHLSDLQFGGNEAGGAFNDYSRIAQFLKDKEINPAIIVITGDIADKGKEKEYQEAYEWLRALIKRIWDTDDEIDADKLKRIVMVPGNHDYDLSVSASDNYVFQFKAEDIETFEKKDNTHTNQKLGFYNFAKFAYKFSNDISWLFYMDKALHINNTFKDWGIRFISLNSAYNISSDNCENRFEKFYCDLSSFNENVLVSEEDVSDGLCNILVSHNPPNNFRKETEKGEKSWSRMQTIIQDNRINIIMSGHTHDFKPASRLSDGGGTYCNRAVCISAPSARLNAASRTEDAARGFNVIEFYRENGNVKKIIPRYFILQKASINEIDDFAGDEYTI